MMEKEYSMRHYRRLSKACADSGFSGDSGFGGYSDSSNNSMGQPPLFTLKMSNSAQNNQNDRRASERAEVLKKHEFTITEELGRGISGRVFLVKNPDEDYFVVKEINYRDNMNFNLDAAKKEINILKKLHHGYIVGYKDSFEEDKHSEHECLNPEPIPNMTLVPESENHAPNMKPVTDKDKKIQECQGSVTKP